MLSAAPRVSSVFLPAGATDPSNGPSPSFERPLGPCADQTKRRYNTQLPHMTFLMLTNDLTQNLLQRHKVWSQA